MLWLDGKPVEGDSALFDLRDRGLMLGDGVFDTSLALSGRMVFAEEHLDRISRSCGMFGIPFDRTGASQTLSGAAGQIGSGVLRLTVTRGAGKRGLLPPPDAEARVIVTANQIPLTTMWKPVRLVTSNIRRNETSPTSRHKCLSYFDAIQATEAAVAAGGDEALFLNTAGNVACCATANVFALTGNRLTTPPETDGVLPGVMRKVILSLAEDAGLEAREASLSPEDLAGADGVFATNSLRMIAPVRSISGVTVPDRGLQRMKDLAHAVAEHLYRTQDIRVEEGFAGWQMTG